MHDPIEYDDRTMENIIAAMQKSSMNGKFSVKQNGSGPVEGYTLENGNGHPETSPMNGNMTASAPINETEGDAELQTKKSKGKGKARAVD